MIVFGKQEETQERRKMLVVLNYYDGDIDAAKELIDLIVDLQPGRTELADFMLFRRHDAQVIPESFRLRLLEKFGRVHVTKCRRMNAIGYPYGPNEMFYDLLDLMHYPVWAKPYHSFLNLESDCVPVDPDWIRKLCDEYRGLCDDGHFAIGHMNEKPTPHLNGSAIYSTDLWQRAGAMQIIGGPAGVAYDIQQSKRIMPLAKDTPLMMLDYNRATITAASLFSAKKGDVSPVLYHGVKDGSARRAVRSFFVEKKGYSDLSSSTIQTFFDAIPGSDSAEQQRQIDIWRNAWMAAGWNAVVNNRFDVARHPMFKEFAAKAKSFPTVNNPAYEFSCYVRWLAFEMNGAGLHTDYDVLPRRNFTPEKLARSEGFNCLQFRDGRDNCSAVPSVIQSDVAGVRSFIDHMMTVPAEADRLINGKPHNSDMYILSRAIKEPWFHGREMCRNVGEEGWQGFPTIHFASEACAVYAPRTAKSSVMLNFVRSNESR
jgi:hypothetical protein